MWGRKLEMNDGGGQKCRIGRTTESEKARVIWGDQHFGDLQIKLRRTGEEKTENTE